MRAGHRGRSYGIPRSAPTAGPAGSGPADRAGPRTVRPPSISPSINRRNRPIASHEDSPRDTMGDDLQGFSSDELIRTHILVVEADPSLRAAMRATLGSLGFGGVSDAPNHALALGKLRERRFTHTIFEARGTNVPVLDFLRRALDDNPGLVAIPSSADPSVDDVFSMLLLGARGYIVKPFAAEAVEEAMLLATKGEPLPRAVLNAVDRNQALSAIVMTSLDGFATVLRQARQFESARMNIPKAERSFRRAIDLAGTFAEGGKEGLLEALIEFALERADGPATKLGRLRKRLKSRRA
jgi:DNA-binding NarL/FixJ family response regulator